MYFLVKRLKDFYVVLTMNGVCIGISGDMYAPRMHTWEYTLKHVCLVVHNYFNVIRLPGIPALINLHVHPKKLQQLDFAGI